MPAKSLRICRTNTERFALPLALWEAEGHDVCCVDCLAQCGDCEAGPFVEVEGELVFEDTLAALVARISPARA
jgi:uncharacterized protein YuzB (UPF0349 family)